MKKKLLFLCTGILMNFCGLSQFSDNAPCTTGNPSGGSFINWTAQNFTIYTNAMGTTTIQSPFYLTTLNNPNVNEFSKYADKDFLTSEGWELWKHDFGTPTARTDVPFFVLYNRHTGLMRVFIAFANLLGQNNAISIQLKYKDNAHRSALLENYNNDDARNATQIFRNDVHPIVNSNYYLNNALIWYHSDFYLHFDPCICNYKSSLVLEVKLSNNGSFTFEIKGQAIQNIAGGQGTDANGRFGEKGIFSSFFDIKNQPYKSIGIIRDGYAGSVLLDSLFRKDYLELPDKTKNSFVEIFDGLVSNLPIAAAFTNFITSIFKKNNQAQVRPMVFDINLKGKGDITYTYNYSFNEFVVPGSEQTLLSTEILPYYNKPAGVFTLLKEPTIEYLQRIVYSDEWTPELHEITTEEVFRLKNETIHYTVNPNAGFDLAQSQIKAQLIYKYNDEKFAQTPLVDLGCLKDFQRYFSHYRSYSPQDPNLNYEEGWVPTKTMLKIVAKFKVAGTTLEVPYVATYNLNKVLNYNLPYLDADPPNGCSATFAEANSATIKSVCNSSEYQSKASQYGRIRSDIDNNIDSLLTKKEIKIYPNPINDYLQISLPQSNMYNEFKVEIFSMIGKTVAVKKFSGITGIITLNNLSFLPGGLYLVRLSDDKGQILQTSKIIKK